MPEISERPLKEMTQDELQDEFRTLAIALQPINARRKAIADEMKRRESSAHYDLRIQFMDDDQKAGMFDALKRKLGK